jgi:hypothetical protein
MTECAHGRYREVETCNECELVEELDEAIAHRDDYEAAHIELGIKYRHVTEERDEARNLVRALLKSGLHPLEREAWEREFPWLGEKAEAL